MDVPVLAVSRIQPSSFSLFYPDPEQIGWGPCTLHKASDSLQCKCWSLPEGAPPNNYVWASWSSLGPINRHIENVLVLVSAYAIIKASFVHFFFLSLSIYSNSKTIFFFKWILTWNHWKSVRRSLAFHTPSQTPHPWDTFWGNPKAPWNPDWKPLCSTITHCFYSLCGKGN